MSTHLIFLCAGHTKTGVCIKTRVTINADSAIIVHISSVRPGIEANPSLNVAECAQLLLKTSNIFFTTFSSALAVWG